MRVVSITGTSKGLGYELAKGYLDDGYLVIGIARSEPQIDHSRYHHFCGDVTSNDIIADLGLFVEGLAIEKIDILINNAGTGSLGYSLVNVSPDEVLGQVNLHCIGALRVLKALGKYLNESKIVNVTSRLASITQNKRGDFNCKEFSYGYRIGKCAQNMLSLCLTNDPELSSATIMSINPGLLRTDSGSNDAEYSAEEGAKRFISTVSKASQSGIYHSFSDEALY